MGYPHRPRLLRPDRQSRSLRVDGMASGQSHPAQWSSSERTGAASGYRHRQGQLAKSRGRRPIAPGARGASNRYLARRRRVRPQAACPTQEWRPYRPRCGGSFSGGRGERCARVSERQSGIARRHAAGHYPEAGRCDCAGREAAHVVGKAHWRSAHAGGVRAEREDPRGHRCGSARWRRQAQGRGRDPAGRGRDENRGPMRPSPLYVRLQSSRKGRPSCAMRRSLLPASPRARLALPPPARSSSRA